MPELQRGRTSYRRAVRLQPGQVTRVAGALRATRPITVRPRMVSAALTTAALPTTRLCPPRVRTTVRRGRVQALRLMALMLAVVPTRRKATRPPTRGAMRPKVLAGGTQRLREPILHRAAATAAVAHLMLAEEAVHPTVVEAAEVHMGVAAVLTAIAKISEISIFQKGPSLSIAAGLLFS